MKRRAHCLLLLFFALSITPRITKTFEEGISDGKMIFVVWPTEEGKQPTTTNIEPLVILDGGHFLAVPAYDYKEQKKSEAEIDRFEKKYFTLGQKYPLLMGGSDRGVLIVQGTIEPALNICFDLTANAILPFIIAKPQMALAATSSQGLGVHENWRKQATIEQRPIFLKLVRKYLVENGVKTVSDGAIKIEQLYSTKLGTKSVEALIGNITLKQKTGIHHVFLVAEKRTQQYEKTLGTYHKRADDESADVVIESFVDQLDMDDDGLDEIVTMNSYYESLDYNIYKREQGEWKKVYEGGGGGC